MRYSHYEVNSTLIFYKKERFLPHVFREVEIITLKIHFYTNIVIFLFIYLNK